MSESVLHMPVGHSSKQWARQVVPGQPFWSNMYSSFIYDTIFSKLKKNDDAVFSDL